MKKSMFILAFLISPILFGEPDRERLNDITSITLERTACYQACPSYRVTIYEDGSVVFEGRADVVCIGIRRGKLSLSTFKELQERILNMHFGMFQNRYDTSVDALGNAQNPSDEPKRIVTVSFRGESKTVNDYGGAPVSLTRLEEEVDKLCNTKRWILGGGEPQP